MNPKKISWAVLSLFCMAAFSAMFIVLAKWFCGTVSSGVAPGWEWCRVTTGCFLGFSAGAAVMWIAYGLFSSKWFCDQRTYEPERKAAEKVLSAFSAAAGIVFMPTFLWWGLYLA